VEAVHDKLIWLEEGAEPERVKLVGGVVSGGGNTVTIADAGVELAPVQVMV